jgi:hypothetical protein
MNHAGHSMQRKPSFTAIVLLIALFVFQEFAPLISAQTAIPTAQQLDQLLAPVALYPDSLLAQITTASTNPQEILDVANWLQQNPGLKGTALTDTAEKQGFDPAFIVLSNFPQVLDMMAQHVDDYAAIGQAFLADQGAVTASIQRLRAQAYAAGSLRSNSQQQVEVQQAAGQTIYVIQPANPQIVYVPQYNPTVVYVAPSTNAVVATTLISFGAGIAIGALLVDNRPWGWAGWGWSWTSRRVYYNHVVGVRWGNPYRPPHMWYRPRPVLYSNRPGYGGNWRYRPPNYRPPYRPGPGYSRPPYGPSNKPGYRPPANRPGGGRPPVQTKPPRPTQPIVKPGSPKPPSATRPPVKPPGNGTAKPPNTNRPPARTRPTSPNQQSVARPGSQQGPMPNGPQQHKKPASEFKPAPRSQPQPRSQRQPQAQPDLATRVGRRLAEVADLRDQERSTY